MIGSSRRDEAVRLLREDVAALRQSMETLSRQLAAEMERAVFAREEQARVEQRLAQLAGLVTAQAETLETQARAIAEAREALAADAETIRQLRGDLTRQRRQAEIDLAELRETSVALAKAAFIRTDGFGGSAAPLDRGV